MKTRTGRAARLLAFALLLPASGCCTIALWEGAPRIEPARLTGATVDPRGVLTVGLEWSDGRIVAYRETSSCSGLVEGGSLCLVMTKALDAADAPRFDHAPSAHGDRIEIADWRPIEIGGSGLVAIVVDRSSGSALEIIGDDGAKRGFVGLAQRDSIDWVHPGTWLRVVATPVTVAVDAVTYPIQVIVIFFHAPHS